MFRRTKQPKISQAKVTLPTFEELADLPTTLTNYTVETAPYNVYPSFRHHNVIFGEAWLRTLGDNCFEAQTYALTGFETRQNHRKIDSDWVAVMPHIENPELSNLDTKVVDGTEILTMNGETVYYPQSRVGSMGGAILTSSRRDCIGKDMHFVGAFTKPNAIDPELRQFRNDIQVCFHYNGKNYVHTQDDQFCDKWFNCEPVRAIRCADGSIQCIDMLFTAQLDDMQKFVNEHYAKKPGENLDITKTALGKYLNTKFLNDLKLSTQLNHVEEKLSQMLPVFKKNNLKANQQDNTQSL